MVAHLRGKVVVAGGETEPRGAARGDLDGPAHEHELEERPAQQEDRGVRGRSEAPGVQGGGHPDGGKADLAEQNVPLERHERLAHLGSQATARDQKVKNVCVSELEVTMDLRA